MVSAAPLEDALAQVATLTAALEGARAEAAVERAALLETIKALVAQVQALTRQVEALLAKKARKESKTAAPPPDPSNAGAAQPDDRPKPPPAPPPRPKKRRRPPEPKPSAALPTSTEELRPDACAHCGGKRLSNKDTEEFELLDYVPGYYRRKIIRRTRCRCADCALVTTPARTGACLPKTHYSAAFAAKVIYDKYGLHLPLERQRRELARAGQPMSNAQLSDLVQRCLSELSGVADCVVKRVLAGTHCQSDATGIPVLVRGQPRTHHGQIFVLCWGVFAAYVFSTDKKAETFAKMVSAFQGTMVLDASSTHSTALETGRITWAACNAHGLRKFREAVASEPELGAEGERWIASWFDADRLGREAGLAGADLLKWRQDKIRPLVKDFRRWLTKVHPGVLPKSPLAEATRYYMNHWKALTRFLRDPDLPLDNNLAERCLRAVAVGRNNWQFAGSEGAGHNTAVALTLVQTARLVGVDVLDYLTWALERVAGCREGGGLYADLTPWAYKEAKEREAGRA